VLTAGLGTRFRPLSFVRAKAAVPLGREPLVGRILRWLAAQGVHDVVLNLHHLPDTITARVGDGRQFGVAVRYSWEPILLGSAGGPRLALPLLPSDDFFIINGDYLTRVDLRALAAEHQRTGARVTMAVVENQWPERYSGVITDASGIVAGFVPRGSMARSYHFISVQIVHPSVFAELPINQPAESVGDLYRRLIAERPGSVRAFLSRSSFLDVGTPADYLEAALSIGRAEGSDAIQIGDRCRIDPTARLFDTVIWDDVAIGPNAELRRCIVADGVRIPANQRFEARAIVEDRGALVAAEMSDG
jgi:NDP-sugar pyrophosphorylase family protein